MSLSLKSHLLPTERHGIAMRFVLLIGVLSFFADMTHEGSRSILGPFLGSMQVSAFAIGAITGFGECAGYGIRYFSGRLADLTGKFWPIAIVGYVVQMASVPALALVDSWESAAALIVLERIGRAIRNPPRDVMLSHAAQNIGGYGWTFGVHEACDQLGAMLGPLAMAGVLAFHADYQLAFAVLAIPATLNLAFLALARHLYPRPADLENQNLSASADRYSPRFWPYMAGACLIAFGFADYPLLAYHFTRTGTVPLAWIPIFYSIAMAVSGASSLFFGRLFDRYGFVVLIGLTFLSSLFAPLVFLGNFYIAMIGAAIWGMGMGVHESIIPAAVTPMVPANRRAAAFGLFTGAYGVFWFLGSAAIGLIYERSIDLLITICLVSQLLAVPFFAFVNRETKRDSDFAKSR
ncbi:Arabinose efflux permease [Achromobacter xylosoxidans]|uniref:MFS transporter n=1 Tax=Alcaligenes xylosoxydans xylosoxydans TaxID=85698 RepID=UPI0006C6F642|nr:MFS transporter [Achromobacter xylosoxidans]CUJ03266.1 Arabinose efflux permease [Achromobacter xylosoxidans]CUJ19576.1 Arabinose efflux permease [Achromobacter xylosoxidans]